ncbi:MAG: hypothetical protein CO137_01950 [Candidatus Magasanikbacteria bacterium CG_4_9_14_3_um_filter_32_9]|uniref:Uncharacterized protein n=1 Tax=Candidatus Magasanikbacteria bacterium CG_4_9_14_3_um_filter_32_9 TaxID=1974644 RepID=A0A2M7Z717_9BACT|nr:MAG: hypothetical protein CO137_01950 [Candidatus Magasanikbacteria bacterium CG_4_9_14_3_um_filter_32_9]
MSRHDEHKLQVLETQEKIRKIDVEKGRNILLTTFFSDIEHKITFVERMSCGRGIVVHFEGEGRELLWSQIRKIRY